MEKLRNEPPRGNLGQGNNGRMRKGGIGLVTHVAEGFTSDFIANEFGNDLSDNMGIGAAGEISDFSLSEAWPGLGDIEPAIGG